MQRDISISSDKIPFFVTTKTQAIAFYKVTFVLKNVQNGGAPLHLFFKESWLHS